MEIVGDLPGPEEILPNTVIPPFGILCKNVTNSAECHFCLETIKNEETRTFATPCCKQKVHCSCFERWAVTAVTITGSTTVRCAYCRTIFPSEQLCFLCLKKKGTKQWQKPDVAEQAYITNVSMKFRQRRLFPQTRIIYWNVDFAVVCGKKYKHFYVVLTFYNHFCSFSYFILITHL